MANSRKPPANPIETTELDLGGDPEEQVSTEPEAPLVPLPAAPDLEDEKKSVKVGTSQGAPRESEYRVLASKTLFHKAQQLRFKKGDVFKESTLLPAVRAAFVEQGLELEQVK